MTVWRTLGLFTVLLLLPQPAQSMPQDTPEEDLPITPRPVLPQTGPGKDDSAAGGLSLDDAINRLVHFNYDLRTRYQDILEARADELTASLFSPPALFLSGHQMPYGRYSPQRPGTPSYEITPAAFVDYSGKRKSHMRESRLETREVEARYQNAVRLEVDRVYDAYVDVLEARERVQAARADLQQLVQWAATGRQGQRTEADRIALQRFTAESALQEAELVFRQRKQQLAMLLAIPPENADSLVITGFLEDRFPPPPSVVELIPLALASRPDLTAQRLGSERDKAVVQVTKAERFDDASLFYSPFEIQNNTPQGLQSSTGWGGGLLFSVPLLNRNQGVIARAKINEQQGLIEVEGLERMAVNEVRQAWTEYTASRQVVQQYEQEGLPAAHGVLSEALRNYNDGKEDIDAVLQARKNYGEMIRLYRESLVRHRRSMLKLNTAVGKRILP